MRTSSTGPLAVIVAAMSSTGAFTSLHSAVSVVSASSFSELSAGCDSVFSCEPFTSSSSCWSVASCTSSVSCCWSGFSSAVSGWFPASWASAECSGSLVSVEDSCGWSSGWAAAGCGSACCSAGVLAACSVSELVFAGSSTVSPPPDFADSTSWGGAAFSLF